MNYFQFHIGDYAAHTRGLSLLEDLAYRRILDAYYQAEGPLSGDVARLIGMRDHADSVAYVLATYFTETPEGWRNKRADAEIAAYVRMRDGGAKGSAKRWAKGGDRWAIAAPSPSDPPPNSNQEPVTIKDQERMSANADAQPVDRLTEVTEQALDAYNGYATAHALPIARRVAMEKKRAWVKRSLRVIREVCAEAYGSPLIPPEFWPQFFDACAADPFLRGEAKSRDHPNWKPDFEYLTRPDVIAKVYERNAND